jgi:peptide/nickel transport system ATP-binding protein
MTASIASAALRPDALEDRVLDVRDLFVGVPSSEGSVAAVRGASFTVGRGEAVGLVGESGSGKTLTCRAVLGVLPPGCEVTDGAIELDGDQLASFGPKEWQRLRGARVGAIFQDPTAYLTPSIPVGRQLAEVLRAKAGLSRRAARAHAIELFGAIGLRHPSYVYQQLPSELSGGMLQRVMIAIAIAVKPQLVIADEATTALDVVTQADVLELLRDLRGSHGISLLFVSHDLAVVAELCHRIVVFYAGEIVEAGEKDELVAHPRHPYTEALLRVGSARSSGKLEFIPGQPPAVGEERTGCRFAGRCQFAIGRCSDHPVPLVETADGRAVRCIRADELDLTGGHLADP